MIFKFPPVSCVLECLIACVIVSIGPGFCSSESHYTPWGVDEYQLIGLTQQELSTKFKRCLFFSKDFDRATLSQNGTGLGYQGPVFKLSFSNGRVSSVHGVFEGCTQTYERPRFDTKEEALDYAIAGLSSYTGPQEQKSLAQAKQALAELKRASSVQKAQTR
jgi:hypothetical protein